MLSLNFKLGSLDKYSFKKSIWIFDLGNDGHFFPYVVKWFFQVGGWVALSSKRLNQRHPILQFCYIEIEQGPSY